MVRPAARKSPAFPRICSPFGEFTKHLAVLRTLSSIIFGWIAKVEAFRSDMQQAQRSIL